MLALAIEFTGGTRVTRAFGKDSDSRQAPCGRRGRNRRFGGHSGGETPGPIPNPEVKPSSADGTAWEARWESRSPPRHSKERHLRVAFFAVRGCGAVGSGYPWARSPRVGRGC